MEIRTYKSAAEMKREQQKEVNAFPFGWAFGREQFREMMRNWGLCSGADGEPTAGELAQIVSIGAGGFVKKTDIPAMREMFERHKAEQKAFRERGKGLFEMFRDALANHEYIVTGRVSDALDALGISEDELNGSEQMRKALAKAIKWNKQNCMA